MLSLLIWLSIGRPAAFLCGLLAAGAFFATVLGLLLLPLSFVGLLFAPVSILGFSPLLTSFVFVRNTVGASRRARYDKIVWLAPAMLGILVAVAGPVAAQYYVSHQTSRALELVRSADPATATAGIALFKRMRFCVDSDELVNEYGMTSDAAQRQRLAKAYRELTGTDIDLRAQELWND